MAIIHFWLAIVFALLADLVAWLSFQPAGVPSFIP
jgi:hypothetical protein